MLCDIATSTKHNFKTQFQNFKIITEIAWGCVRQTLTKKKKKGKKKELKKKGLKSETLWFHRREEGVQKWLPRRRDDACSRSCTTHNNVSKQSMRIEKREIIGSWTESYGEWEKREKKASGKTFYISEKKKKNESINYLCTHGPIYIPTRC